MPESRKERSCTAGSSGREAKKGKAASPPARLLDASSTPRRRRRNLFIHPFFLATLALLSLAAIASAQMSSTWLGTKDLSTVMEGKPPAAPAPPPPPPPPPPPQTQAPPTTTAAVASSSAAPRDANAVAVLPAAAAVAGPSTTTLALIPVGDGSFAAVPVALAAPAGAAAGGGVTPNNGDVGFGFGAAALPVSSPAAAASLPAAVPAAPTSPAVASSAAPPRSLVGVSRADDEAPDPINVEHIRPVGVASRAGRQAPSSGGGGRGMPGGFAAPREADPGVGLVVGAVAPPSATTAIAPRTVPAPVFTGIEPGIPASASAASSASSAPAFSTPATTMPTTSLSSPSPSLPAAIPTTPGLSDGLSSASLSAMAANKPPRAAVQPPPGTLVGGMVVGDDGRPYLPADLEDAAAASGALRGAGILPPQDSAAVAEGFAAPADVVAAVPRGPTVQPFAAPNNNNEAVAAASAASSPAPSAASPSASAASSAPAPSPSDAASSNSSSASRSGGGFDCVAAALKLIAQPAGGSKPLCPTGDLRESQASLIARARCSMLVDQVLARPTPSGQCCSALRDFTKNGCSCSSDVVTEAAKLGFSSTMLFATARVAQVACGRGSVFNSCDQSFGC